MSRTTWLRIAGESKRPDRPPHTWRGTSMRYTRVTLAAALVLSTAGCSWRRTPVPVISDIGSTALLVGDWSGEYSSRDTGRSGSITFAMASEKDTAYCDVVMVPKYQTLRVTTQDRPDIPAVRPEALAEPLKIRFIRLGDGRVSGTLDPYVDPECGCRVTTTFDGKFTDANTITGSYVTRGSGLLHPTSGEWKVKRQSLRASVK